MGSQMNFKGFGDASLEGNGSKAPGNFPLARQSSIYSMTFDELQNMGGLGKDFGSMNMDELLKNLWTAEETQAMMTASAAVGEGSGPGGNLQRQGSLTLPRTLSQKTVDEVWKDLLKESGGVKDESSSGGGPNLPQRQHTLGEITLEEFLVRAGVVREDAQQMAIASSAGFFGDLSRQGNNPGLALGFQQANQNNGLLGNNNSVLNHQPPRLALNMGDVQAMQQQQQQQRQRPPLQQLQQQPQPLFPKQTNVAFAPCMQVVNPTRRASPVTRGPVGGIGDQNQPMNNKLVQPTGLQTGGMGIGGLGSPISKISPDIVPKSSLDTSSLSPSPYAFGRGRKCSAALEKVVERRQRRMIKNRESAARSRARKQAYTLELEAEVAKLKELNEELQKKQMEMMELQKNQMLQDLRLPWGSKRQCLRRTLTGPW